MKDYTATATQDWPLVNFVCLDPDGHPGHDRHILAHIAFEPQIGDRFKMTSDGREAVVRSKRYKLVDTAAMGEPTFAMLNVVLAAPDQVPISVDTRQR